MDNQDKQENSISYSSGNLQSNSGKVRKLYHSFLSVIMVLVLVGGVGITINQLQQRQDVRQHAAEPVISNREPIELGTALWESKAMITNPNPNYVTQQLRRFTQGPETTYYDKVKQIGYRWIVPHDELKMYLTEPTAPSGPSWVPGNTTPDTNALSSIYDFAEADKILNFGSQNNIKLHGHTLIWMEQLPTWFTNIKNENCSNSTNLYSSQQVTALFENRIRTMVRRYKGRILTWDVVNEGTSNQINPSFIRGNAHLRNTIWSCKVGPDYIERAFRIAHEEDPNAILLFNDYSIEGNGQKSDDAFTYVKYLKDNGVPIGGIGFQSHMDISGRYPADNAAKSLQNIYNNMMRYNTIGIPVYISELDATVTNDNSNPSDPQKLAAQADLYRGIATACYYAPNCKRIITWGFTDKYSWLYGFLNKSDAPLPFDANYNPKPAYQALSDIVNSHNSVITVYAAGTPADGVYPSLALSVNGIRVKQWDNIQGNPSQRSFQELSYYIPSNYAASQIKVEYVNDYTGVYSATNDRNVMIDKIVVDGQNYESEDPSTYSVGSYTNDNGCNGGYKKGEWLQCAGYFLYKMRQSAVGSSPTATPVIPAIQQGGVTINSTVFNAWRVWVNGTNINNESGPFTATVFSSDNVLWAKDIETRVSDTNKFVAFSLPSRVGPSGCNLNNSSCQIKVQLTKTSNGQQSNIFAITLPAFVWQTQDIGGATAQQTSYANGQFSLSSNGYDIFGTSDSFSYASQGMIGDGEIIARVAKRDNPGQYAKAGIMIRENLTPSSSNISLVAQEANKLNLTMRNGAGTSTNYIAGSVVSTPIYLKLKRSGNNFVASFSSDGNTWQQLGSTTVPMASTVYLGLVSTSNNTNQALFNTAIFDMIQIR